MRYFKYPEKELPWPWQRNKGLKDLFFCNRTLKEEEARQQYIENQENETKALKKILTSAES